MTEAFDPTRVSPSRVNKLTECGIAFRRYYLEGEPTPRKGSFALNGSVIHKALETWATDRTQPLFGLVQDAWETETAEAPIVMDFLRAYRKISADVIRAEHAAREAYNKDPRNVKAGKTSTAPRMTKHFKESKAAKDLYDLLRVWGPRLTAESPWEFTDRDPLPQFYDDSLVLAKRYEKQYGHLPPALYTELAVEEPWRDFTLRGFIDSVELLMHPETGEVQGVGVIDYKTYRREPAEHKDYRQLVMYDAAVRELLLRRAITLPDVPIYVGIDYVKFAGVEVDWLSPAGNSRRFWKITDEDYDRVERELNAYKATVEAEAFLPAAKGTNPDYCDYGATCCLRSTSAAGGCAAPVEVTL